MSEHENNLAAPLPGGHYEAEDLLLYVLEMVTPSERSEIEAHLEGCAQCRQELAELRHDIGIYALASVESAPSYATETVPDRSRERLMAEVARTAAGAPQAQTVSQAELASEPQSGTGLGLVAGGKTSSGAGRRPGASPRIAPWIGWAVAATLAVVAGHFYQDRETIRQELSAQSGQIAQLSAEQARAREIVDALTDRSAQRVTLSLTKAPTPPQPSGRATYLADKGTLIFLASHLEQLPAGKTYELWVIPASGKPPIPAGTFEPDERGNASVVTAKLAGAGAAKAFGVTIEASGGAATPTMPILLAGS